MRLILRSLGSVLLAVGCSVGAFLLIIRLAIWMGPSDPDADVEVLTLVGVWVFLSIPLGWALRRLGQPVEPDWETPFE